MRFSERPEDHVAVRPVVARRRVDLSARSLRWAGWRCSGPAITFAPSRWAWKNRTVCSDARAQERAGAAIRNARRDAGRDADAVAPGRAGGRSGRAAGRRGIAGSSARGCVPRVRAARPCRPGPSDERSARAVRRARDQVRDLCLARRVAELVDPHRGPVARHRPGREHEQQRDQRNRVKEPLLECPPRYCVRGREANQAGCCCCFCDETSSAAHSPVSRLISASSRSASRTVGFGTFAYSPPATRNRCCSRLSASQVAR